MLIEEEKMHLVGNNVIIRNFEEKDFDSFYRLVKNKSNHDLSGMEYSTDINEAKEIFSRYMKIKGSYCIALKPNSLMVGIIELNERGVTGGLERTRELGFIIEEKYRRQGLASEAVDLMINYSFNELELTELWAAAEKSNVAPQKLLVKHNFKYIYEVKQEFTFFGGEDNVIKYYLLKQ
ncbi:GNAT family N-acetyltransferase [Companilactobacillus hulinensis]|uniref:GNAT family N-acetyltransferase n=1 Tax=Companilactobacillus hulinensis TaxID=2486007 RepID=UPI000F7A62D0|nr:GNAT family N-acetyltransferase [Companilactobacillus hulinensis]